MRRSHAPEGALPARGGLPAIPGYEVLEEIANGGMGSVYLARLRRALGFTKLVAIKCLHPKLARDPAVASMFVDEARLTAGLRHPNIVATLDIATTDSLLFLVMEYVEGESLSSLLRLARDAGARIPPPIACAIVRDMLLGLHAAHEARGEDGRPLGIVHCDISPHNVLLGIDGLARVADFGVARVKRSPVAGVAGEENVAKEGPVFGKVGYAAPEILAGEATDFRADLWAAGAVLWELLVGRKLFAGVGPDVRARVLAYTPVEAPSARTADVSPELDAIVLRLLGRPEGRGASGVAMAEALERTTTVAKRTEVEAWVRRYVPPRRFPSAAPSGEGSGCGDASYPADAHPDTAGAFSSTITVPPPLDRRSSPGVLAPVLLPQPTYSRARIAATVAAALSIAAGLLVFRPESWAERSSRMTASKAEVVGTSSLAKREERLVLTAAPMAPMGIDARAPAAAREATTPVAKASPPAAKAARAAKIEAVPQIASAPASDRPSCRPPYTVDSGGRRHYRVECL